jgi:hypothetical protein
MIGQVSMSLDQSLSKKSQKWGQSYKNLAYQFQNHGQKDQNILCTHNNGYKHSYENDDDFDGVVNEWEQWGNMELSHSY